MLKRWEELPDFMRVPEVSIYWEILNKKRGQLFLKRIFDFIVALLLLFILFVPMILIAMLIKVDSNGPIFYCQERVTIYGKKFRIHKFRTMVNNADKIGAAVTVLGDNRVTRIGDKLRRFRLDELPQIFDILSGNMSFVGTRPEVTKYVQKYTNEMKATLLLRAGITSEASIRYKDESELLDNADDVDKIYIKIILPAKMKYNLDSIKNFSVFSDIRTMIKTVIAVLEKKH